MHTDFYIFFWPNIKKLSLDNLAHTFKEQPGVEKMPLHTSSVFHGLLAKCTDELNNKMQIQANTAKCSYSQADHAVPSNHIHKEDGEQLDGIYD